MRLNKGLLFGSLGAAAAIILAVSVVAASRDDSTSSADDDVTLTSSNDLSPTIGTNAAVTGRQFPAVDIQTLKGDTFSTADLVGMPLIVNFWYSTCAPCKKELREFAAVHAKLGDRVRFVGIDSFPASAEEEAFARDKGVQYELLYDANGALATAVGVAAWPQTLFIDTNGTIVEQTGVLSGDKLEELIRNRLL